MILRVIQLGAPLSHVGSRLQRASVPYRQVPAHLVTCLQQWPAGGLICAPDKIGYSLQRLHLG